MRHGYFLPGRGLFGDPELAAEAEAYWRASPAVAIERVGHYDGCSIFIFADGQKVCRMCLQDFFSEKFRVEVRDWNGIGWERPR